jgi:hypothetical protein
LKQIRKEINEAKTKEDLIKIRDERVRKLERVEQRMDRRLKRLTEKGKELAKALPEKKTEIEADLKTFKKYRGFIVAVLSRGGVLETSLTYPQPSNWFPELGKMTTLKEVGNDNFEARKRNSIKAIDEVFKWDKGFYLKLKDFEKFLKRIK